ncbi:citrate lyase acyl carrier protein [candidate division KSB3 bacterium]|uniref:Citrate lyase acyl carrier protein n=1 Tax=candidate division KSB3 bacterium TaxID=2044937 RepID=A0A2G6E4R0_9BACT|nr:MAG: citrate lyase acyl carrier protein [candidate division KSB3 bacterium]PIE29637.1 MAG: citrate lyase acyl carrier protein [candidate division KSB3 bacterium]
MELISEAVAGTLESSDAFILIERNPGQGIEIELESLVQRRYGQHVLNITEACLHKLGVRDARVKIHDKGALDCTLEARLQTAIFRAAGIDKLRWEVL